MLETRDEDARAKSGPGLELRLWVRCGRGCELGFRFGFTTEAITAAMALVASITSSSYYKG